MLTFEKAPLLQELAEGGDVCIDELLKRFLREAVRERHIDCESRAL